MKYQTLSKPYTDEELIELDGAEFSVFVVLSDKITKLGKLAIQSFFTLYYLKVISIVDFFDYNIVDPKNGIVNITGKFRLVGE